MAKTNSKTTTKAAAKPAPAPVVVTTANRYERAAKVIIEFGVDGEPNEIDLDELAVRCGYSKATAGYTWVAFQGVCAALRNAKLLSTRQTAAKADVPQSAAKAPVLGPKAQKAGLKQAVVAETGLQPAESTVEADKNGRLVAQEGAEPEPAMA